MARLDSRPHGEGGRAPLEDALRGFVLPVPRLKVVPEKEGNTFDEDLPC